MYEQGILSPKVPPTLGSLTGSITSQLPQLQNPLQQQQPTQELQQPEQFLTKQEIKRRIDIAKQQGVDPRKLIDEMMNRGYTLEGLNDGKNKSFDQMQLKQQENQGMQQQQDQTQIGAIKGIPANLQKDEVNKERNDQLIPRANPSFPYNPQTDAGAPNAVKMMGNTPSSLYNVVSDVGNMALNPYDTAKGLVQTISGAGVNLTKRGLSKFDEDAPEQIDANIQALKGESGFMGRLANTLDGNEEVADQVAGAISDRYGSSENFAKTMTEDPVGVISDIAMVLETGGATIAKVGKLGGATKIADVASDVSKFGAKVDPYNMAMDVAGKGIGAGLNKTVDIAKNANNSVGNITKKSLDRIHEQKTGLSRAEVDGIQNNPYQHEYRERLRQTIESVGVPPSAKETLRPYLEEISSTLVGLIDRSRAKLSDSGPLYNEVRKLKDTIPMENVHANLDRILDKSNILIKPDGTLDFSKSRYIQGRDTNAITSVYNRIKGQGTLNVTELLNLRKAIDSARKRDGAPTESSGLLTKIRKLVDKEAKAIVPQLKELDEAYAKQIREIKEVEEGLIYRQGDRKGKLRDNFISIIKNLGGENRGFMRDRLLQIMPDIEARVDAINNLPKIAKAYTSVPKFSKTLQSATLAIAGGAVGGLQGMVGGAVLGWLTENFTQKIRKEALATVFAEMSPQAKNKLDEINKKIEDNDQLNKSEREFIEKIKTKLQAEQMKEKYEKPKNKALPAPKPTPVTPEGTVKKKNPIPPPPSTKSKKDITETGQKNVSQPTNRIREQAKKEAQAKQLEREKKLQEKQRIKDEAKQKYDSANGVAITNLSDMSAGMQVKAKTFSDDVVYGEIEKIVIHRGKNRIKLKGNDTYFVSGIAKQGSPIKTPSTKKKTKPNPIPQTKQLPPREESNQKARQPQREVSKKREQSEDIINNVLSQRGIRNYEVNTILEGLGIDDVTKLTDQQVEDIRKIALGRDKGDDYRKAFDRLSNDMPTDTKFQTKNNIANKDGYSTRTEAKATVRKYFTEDEVGLAFVENIETPRGQQAYGQYYEKMITIAKDPLKTTATHEVAHAYFDLFSTKKQKKQILNEVKQKQNIKDNLEAEERLADEFASYIQGKSTLTGKIKTYFQNLRNQIKSVFGKESKVRQFFQDIENRKRPENKYGEPYPDQPIKYKDDGKAYLTNKPASDLMKEVKKSEVSKNHLNSMLGRQYKGPEKKALQRLIDEMGNKKSISKDEAIRTINNNEIELNIGETEKYATYNNLYSVGKKNKINGSGAITKVYRTPYETSKQNHFEDPNYFGHTRIHDKGKNRRILEIQSDIFQKDIKSVKAKIIQSAVEKIKKGLGVNMIEIENAVYDHGNKELNDHLLGMTENFVPKKINLDLVKEKTKGMDEEMREKVLKKYTARNEQIPELTKKIEDMTDSKKTYRKRMINEEVVSAINDRKDSFQVPDGRTIAEIEGHWQQKVLDEGYRTAGTFEVYDEKMYIDQWSMEQLAVHADNGIFDINVDTQEYYIRDPVSLEEFVIINTENGKLEQRAKEDGVDKYRFYEDDAKEAGFTVQSKQNFAIDTLDPAHRPIAKFYEKDLIPYLKKTYGGDFVEADGGNRLEVNLKDVKKEVPMYQEKNPIKTPNYQSQKDKLSKSISKYKTAKEAENNMLILYHGTPLKYRDSLVNEGYSKRKAMKIGHENSGEFYTSSDQGFAYGYGDEADTQKSTLVVTPGPDTIIYDYQKDAIRDYTGNIIESGVGKRIGKEINGRNGMAHPDWKNPVDILIKKYKVNAISTKDDLELNFLDPKKAIILGDLTNYKQTIAEMVSGGPKYQLKENPIPQIKQKEITEINKFIDDKMKLNTGARFTTGGKVAGIQNYLMHNYPQHQKYITKKIGDLIHKHDIKEDFSKENEASKKARQKQSKKWRDKYKKASPSDTLMELTPTDDELLHPTTIKDYQEYAGFLKSDISKYYDKFFKNLSNQINEPSKSIDISTLKQDIKKSVDYSLLSNTKGKQYISQINLMKENMVGKNDYSAQRFKKYSREADLGMERLNNYMKSKYGEYKLKLVKIDDILPSQFGEDYVNDSSKYSAKKKKETKLGIDVDDIWRAEDIRPIVVDKQMNIIDGNHRHASAVMNGEKNIYVYVVNK